MNANEPAYPTKYYVPCVDPKAGFVECDGPGLTIRQRFAMTAMQGLLANNSTGELPPNNSVMVANKTNSEWRRTKIAAIASAAAEIADALIAELNRREKEAIDGK